MERCGLAPHLFIDARLRAAGAVAEDDEPEGFGVGGRRRSSQQKSRDRGQNRKSQLMSI
jgi:hypothetical protein